MVIARAVLAIALANPLEFIGINRESPEARKVLIEISVAGAAQMNSPAQGRTRRARFRSYCVLMVQPCRLGRDVAQFNSRDR